MRRTERARRADWAQRALGLGALWIAGCGGTQVQPPAVPAPAIDPAAPAPSWLSDQDLLAVRMRSIAVGFEAQGSFPGVFAERGFLAAGARSTHELVVRKDHCMTMVALGAAGINDLDAGIFESDGRAVAQDAAADARPVLRACAGERARRLYYVLHAYQGNGAFLLVGFEGPGESVHGEPTYTLDSASSSDWSTALVRRGFEPEGPPVELEVRPDHPVAFSLPARDDSCLALVAFAEGTGADVDLVLSDESGAERVRDDANKAWAGVQLCPDASGVYAAEVSVRGAPSVVRVGRFSGRASHVGGERAMWLGEPPPVASLSDSAAGSAKPGQVMGRLLAGEAQERELPAPRGECATVRAQLDDGLERVLLRVAPGPLAPAREGEGWPGAGGVHVCGFARRPLHVQIEARRGAGRYSLSAQPVPRSALKALGRAPEAARAQLLDVMARVPAEWRQGLHVEPIEGRSMQCEIGGACVLSQQLAVPLGQCVSVALIAADGHAVRPHLRSAAPEAASARAGLTTRCVHDGVVLLESTFDAEPTGPVSLVRVVHGRVSRP